MLRIKRMMRVRGRLLHRRAERPRLSVFRSLKYIYAQIIDDKKGVTLAAAKGKKPAEVGDLVAKDLLKKKITKVVFDRGPYKYHGRIRLLAEAARKAGLDF